MFRFALRTDDSDDVDLSGTDPDPVPTVGLDSQKASILKMSHGVSVVLLLSMT